MQYQNILLIMVDQMRADRIFDGGQSRSLLDTQNIEGLARSGAQFVSAYTASPVCSPSRASILTGLLPSQHGLTSLGLSLSRERRTVADALRARGYFCHLAGKSHLQPYAPEAHETGGDGQGLDTPPAEDGWEMVSAHANDYRQLPDDYYGFHRVDLTIGHGDDVAGHFLHWDGSKNRASEAPSPDTTSELGAPSRFPSEEHPSMFVASRAIEVIRECAAQGQPLFQVISFPDPHHPFRPPREYFDETARMNVEMPATFGDDRGLPEHVQGPEIVGDAGATGYGIWRPTSEKLVEALRAEAASINFIDDCVGLIIDTLKDCGLSESTAILFVSDHGDMFGDHGLMFKHGVHYEGVVRVPLVLSAPGSVSELTVEQVVSSIDIAPTILELAGAADDMPCEGQSLLWILKGSQAGRGHAVIEENVEGVNASLGAGEKIRSVITKEGRLTLYSSGYAEYFDRGDDPHELRNAFVVEGGGAVPAEMLSIAMQNLFREVPRGQVPEFSG